MARADGNIRMNFTGVKELKREARKVASNKEINQELKKANVAAADVVAKRSKVTAPVKSGTIRGAIKAAGTSKYARVDIGGKARAYAGRIHYGDPGDSPIKGQPFVHEALKEKWDKVYEAYENALMELAEKLNTK